jgi:uncharacterized protein YbcV (DUF1398 family)
MFTLEQIKEAYEKVKTGNDFPKYIQQLIDLGVKGYDTIIADSRVVYYGDADYKVSTDKKYDALPIAPTTNKELFIEFLLMHQSGQTDYFTFCQQAAQCGIATWRIDIIAMNCTYLNANGEAIVIEKIPA